MNNKALTLSILMAILAVFFVQSYVGSIEEEQQKKFGTPIEVIVAKKNIKEMSTIDETMIAHKLVPRDFRDPNAIPFSPDITDAKTGRKIGLGVRQWVGYIAMVPIKAGEQITYSMISEPGMKTGLSPQVTPGKRAYTIAVSETSGLAKLVKPGDRVDVIGVIDLGGGKANKIVKTLLQDVVILATGRNISNNPARSIEVDPITGRRVNHALNEDPSFSTVTLEVNPVEAEMLALVQANGSTSLTLALRNNEDSDRAAMGAMSYSDVLGTDFSRKRAPASNR